MTTVVELSEMTLLNEPLRDAFLRWQCRVREASMRENFGRPDNAIKPHLILAGKTEPLGQIITVLCRTPLYSKTPELRHMVQSNFDPAQRLESAIQFFSEMYYQKALQFSDVLTATFQPGSPAAKIICSANTCSLMFENYGQRFDLSCAVSTLNKSDPLFEATWWHNMLFNSSLDPSTVILSFKPNWAKSSAEPDFTAT